MAFEQLRNFVHASGNVCVEIVFHEMGYRTTNPEDLCAACGVYTNYGQLNQSGLIESYQSVIKDCMTNDHFPLPNAQPRSPQDTIGHHASGLAIPTFARRSVQVFRLGGDTGLQFSKTRAPFEVEMAPPGVVIRQIFSDIKLLRIDNSDIANPQLVMETCDIAERTAGNEYGNATWACFVFDGAAAAQASADTRSSPCAFSLKLNLIELSTGLPPMVTLVDGVTKPWPCSPPSFHVRPCPPL